MLDSDLPAGGYLEIDLADSAHEPSACAYWTLSAGSLLMDITKTIGGISESGLLYFCSFEDELKANTPYGLELSGGADATAGVYAPIGLATKMNNDDSVLGPYFDKNPVFDSIFVLDESGTLGLTVTKDP